MNNVNIRINSYTQEAQIFLNGVEPSPYSELRNFSYTAFISAPGEVLSALSREMNDDFALAVCGNPYEVSLYEAVARQNVFCEAFSVEAAQVNLSSAERAQRLGAALPQQQVFISTDLPTPAEPVRYGNLTLRFGAAPGALYLPQDVPADLLVSACETFFVNPLIGRAVSALANPAPEQAICTRQTPIFSVSAPEHMEVGQTAPWSIKAFPETCAVPAVTVRSQNPDVVSVRGNEIVAVSSGSTELRAYIVGEDAPFFIQHITAKRITYVSSISLDFPDIGLEEESVPFEVSMLPADADDLDTLALEVSDPSVADLRGSRLLLKKAGTCTVSARTSHASASSDIVVKPRLRALHLSEQKVKINVGRTMPISVKLVPEDAYDAEYTWTSSDPTVAVVVDYKGKSVIKAVGIGSCTLACVSADGRVGASCSVAVESIMYKRTKKKGIARFIPIIVGVSAVAVVASFFIPTGASDPEDPDSPIYQGDSQGDEQGDNQGKLESVLLDVDAATGGMDISAVLDAALASCQEAEAFDLSDNSRFSTVSAYVHSVYFLKALDPSYCYDKAFPQPEPVENGFLVLTSYTFELEGYGSGEGYERWYAYLYPNFKVYSDGSFSYSEDAVLSYRHSLSTADDMKVWIKSEFDCMSVTEVAMP